jgi:hypothetical protein
MIMVKKDLSDIWRELEVDLVTPLSLSGQRNTEENHNKKLQPCRDSKRELSNLMRLDCFYSGGGGSWGGVRLSLLSTAATLWPIVPAPDDRRWVWSSRRNENWQGKPKYPEKTCPSATLSTTNPNWPELGSNTSRRGGKPTINLPSYSTACW